MQRCRRHTCSVPRTRTARLRYTVRAWARRNSGHDRFGWRLYEAHRNLPTSPPCSAAAVIATQTTRSPRVGIRAARASPITIRTGEGSHGAERRAKRTRHGTTEQRGPAAENFLSCRSMAGPGSARPRPVLATTSFDFAAESRLRCFLFRCVAGFPDSPLSGPAD